MAEEEDFSSMPLPDRWVHKVWKVRKEAYEAATKEFKTAQESDPIVREFVMDSGLWKGVGRLMKYIWSQRRPGVPGTRFRAVLKQRCPSGHLASPRVHLQVLYKIS